MNRFARQLASLAVPLMMQAQDKRVGQEFIDAQIVNEKSKEEKEAKYALDHGLQKFQYPDGFYCYARNAKNANRKHNNWIKNENNKT